MYIKKDGKKCLFCDTLIVRSDNKIGVCRKHRKNSLIWKQQQKEHQRKKYNPNIEENKKTYPYGKICSKCKEIKPISDFTIDRKCREGLSLICKKCKSKYAINYYKNHREHLIANEHKWRKDNHTKTINYALMKKYGITYEQKENMKISQNSKCKICKKEFRNSDDAHVDHCHKTGKIRDLLCFKCNSILGFCNDDSFILESAIFYLKKWI